MLKISGLKGGVEDTEILHGIDLEVNGGEVHAIMGPNGSGKSTMAHILMGNPRYHITDGEITFRGESVNDLEPDERARLGMFLAFQYPSEIPGVSMDKFLRDSYNAVKNDSISVGKFSKYLRQKMQDLEMDEKFASRYLNEGFSGGEKKRSEMLQMAVLEPKLAILDETDSGLDIDALRTVAESVNKLVNPEMGVLVITHYQRILRYLEPDHVYIMLNGKIADKGGPELAEKLEDKGYDWIREKTEVEV
ncbi:MAG: Fe-S cluster assembly ATPase SufC [Candidatus Marinimicrobia bacterium]|nr:Fe-S cluster assembly ATPase SufC [Candidatus Neomarinimicrobiota bacterium]MCF7828034.1 Fe-S cluster assembly ATPase SufC [Candidatus Neomarinimicrobiota bacterium]MCF7879211.1 Fe-S cluster assembly ATPase SufC [Candidatus Neomarinimicrobiota bacterium]